MKIKAAILEKSNSPLIIDEIETPKLACGQVLVEVHKSGICGAQINEIEAAKGVDKFLPHLLGHEGGGIVLETGPGVTHVKEGDHVVLHWRKGNGIHSATPKYKWGSKTVNAGWVTTFNSHAVISENRLTVIPKGTDFEIAALMGCAVTTALGMINNNACVKIGQSVVVIGCGGVGVSVVQAAIMAGAYPVIGVDIKDNKLEMAKKFGATHIINSAKKDLREEVLKIVGPKGADVTIDNTGNVRVIETAYNMTKPKGRTILVGVPKHDQNINIHSLPLHFGKVLSGVEGGHSFPPDDIPRYLNLYENDKLELKSLITNHYKLDEINTAITALRAGEIDGRCMIDCKN